MRTFALEYRGSQEVSGRRAAEALDRAYTLACHQRGFWRPVSVQGGCCCRPYVDRAVTGRCLPGMRVQPGHREDRVPNETAELLAYRAASDLGEATGQDQLADGKS